MASVEKLVFSTEAILRVQETDKKSLMFLLFYVLYQKIHFMIRQR